MNQTLRPQPQLGEVLPGALTLALFLLLAYDHDPDAFNYFTAPSTGPGLLAIIGGAFLFASWVFGTLLDTVRNGVVENVAEWCSKHWFHKQPLNWEFFVPGERDKVTQLDEYFFAYYQVKANYAVGILIFIAACIGWFPTRLVGFLTLGVAALLFLFCTLDSISLRKEIKKLTTPHLAPTHAGVYTRLQPSPHGIGVYAIRDIPEGTNIFAGDNNEVREIDKNDFAQVEPAIRQLYEDFCVWKDGKIKGPANFNSLTVGWYLNHSDSANVMDDRARIAHAKTMVIGGGVALIGSCDWNRGTAANSEGPNFSCSPVVAAGESRTGAASLPCSGSIGARTGGEFRWRSYGSCASTGRSPDLYGLSGSRGCQRGVPGSYINPLGGPRVSARGEPFPAGPQRRKLSPSAELLVALQTGARYAIRDTGAAGADRYRPRAP